MIKKLLFFVAVWEVLIVSIVALTGQFIPRTTQYLGGATQTYLSNPLVNFRANFDGNLYLAIAASGYGYAQHAFFPLYPRLINLFAPIFKDRILTGTWISTLSFFVGLLVFNKLLRMDYGPKVINLTILALLAFPVSFFFTSVYTEGVFFLLTVSSFYFSRKNKWLLAGVLGALAANTRLVGIFIFPALFLEWLGRRSESKASLLSLVGVVLVPLGLISYMLFLHKTTGDYLAFVHAQKLFGQSRSEKIVLPYQVIWRYVKMILTVDKSIPMYPTILLEAFVGVEFIALAVISLLKQRPSYSIFNFLCLLTPTLTGTLTSLPRYALTCFPSFILLGLFLSKLSSKLLIFYFLCNIMAMLVFLGLFANGYWVA